MWDEIINAPSHIFYIEHFLNPLFIYILFQNLFLPVAISAVWEILEFIFHSIWGNYSPLFLDLEPSQREYVWDILVVDIGAAIFATALGYALVKYRKIPKVPKNKYWIAIGWLVFRALLTAPVSAIGWECLDLLKNICIDENMFLPWGVFAILVIESLYIWLTWKDLYVILSVWLICATAFFGLITSAPLIAFGVTFVLTVLVFIFKSL